VTRLLHMAEYVEAWPTGPSSTQFYTRTYPSRHTPPKAYLICSSSTSPGTRTSTLCSPRGGQPSSNTTRGGTGGRRWTWRRAARGTRTPWAADAAWRGALGVACGPDDTEALMATIPQMLAFVHLTGSKFTLTSTPAIEVSSEPFEWKPDALYPPPEYQVKRSPYFKWMKWALLRILAPRLESPYFSLVRQNGQRRIFFGSDHCVV
jgi:hypothetical protein